MKYYLALLLLFSQFCRADCQQASDRCVAVGQWNVALSVGAGVISNPLHGGDNIPLILIPSISYYGEKVFFENNTLGYSFFDNEHFTVSAISQLNHEKSYFSRWHPENIFIESSSTNSSSTVPDADIDIETEDQVNNGLNEIIPKYEVDIKEVSDRDWAIDAGIQLNWFIDHVTDAQLKMLYDISNVYNGFNGQLEFTRMMSIKTQPNTMFLLSLGADLHSKNLVDYYYGISKKREPNIKKNYQAKQSVNPYVRLVLKHQLSERWRAKLQVKRIFLASGTANSPLVKEDHINTVFAGLTYDF